ncbi:MAG TPA: ATP-binding protein, partial [Burkholderiales bacterium]|nr:ATP-binding protein [Burkholderiales bacterium]
CAILLLDASGKRFRRGAAPSLPADYFEDEVGGAVRPHAGPCGWAAALKTQVIVADIATETHWDVEHWRGRSLALGLRGCTSTPILSRAQNVQATFAIYRREPGIPDAAELELTAQFAHIAAIAVERAQGDAALKQSKAFLAEAQRLSSTGCFSWHVATNEMTWSEELYRIFELDPAAPLQVGEILARIHPEDRHVCLDSVGRAQAAGADFEHDHRLLLPDGSVKYLHVVGHAGRNAAGELEYFGAIQDVTRRRVAEHALDRLRSELSRVARVTSVGALTASIAHEVNQPLSGIVTNASTCLRMLGSEPPNIEGARETARRTIRDGQRASEVIARLRALFSNKAAIREPVDLNEAAREVLALSYREVQRNRAVLREQLAADLPLVKGDRVQLQQVIMNLLLNALEAMSGIDERPRELSMSTQRDADERVRLSVQDSGPGLPPGHGEHLFEAFHTTKTGGMGIGLFVSRSIIESHGGRLWAQANDGPGATFSFSIPCDA